MADLPDWTTSVQGVALEATSFRSGLDADKPAAPAVGEIFYGRDTKVLWICAVAGSWTGFDASILVEGILTLYADMVAGGYKITGLGAPTSDNDAARKKYVDDADALRLLLAGGTMSGAIAMGSQKITGLGDPTAAQDAATKTYVDSEALAFTELDSYANRTGVSIADTWGDWDLSAIVPAGTKSVLVGMGNASTTTVYKCGARKNGQTYDRQFQVPIGRALTHYASVLIVTEVDTNRVIEIRAESTTLIQFNILGYWS